MSFITKHPESRRKVHQTTGIVGRNGLPIDSVLSIVGKNPLIRKTNLALVSYTGGVVTLPSSYDLLAVKNSDPKYTGQLILTTKDGAFYFINRLTIDDVAKTFSIFLDADFTAIPATIDLAAGWEIAEADFLNQLATTSQAQIDEVNFRGFDISFRLNGKEDSVSIVDSNGNELLINPNGSINTVQVPIPIQTPLIQNIPAALTATEYSFTLPVGTKQYLFKPSSSNTTIQFSFQPGQSNINFMTIPAGATYKESVNLTSPVTVYFRVSKPGQVIQVLSWS